MTAIRTLSLVSTTLTTGVMRGFSGAVLFLLLALLLHVSRLRSR